MPKKPQGRAGLPPELLEMLSSALGGAFQDVVTPEQLLEEIAELPLLPQTEWLVAARPIPGLGLPEGDPLLMLVVALHSGEMLFGEVLESDRLDEVGLTLLDVMLDPEDQEADAYRPARILTPDAPLAFSLGGLLRDVGIRVERATLPGMEEMLGQAVRQMQLGAQAELSARQPRPFLTGLPDQEADQEVRALVAAFDRFMQARVWDVFPADKPLYARWENEDGSRGQVYVTVMGEMGETFGLALYPDWLTYADHLNNSGDMELVLEVTGGLEALSQGGQDEFAPEDWATLKRLKLLRGRNPTGPSLLRMGLEGAFPPRTPVHALTAILNALAERAERRANRVTSLKAEADGVRLSFPAGPRDELSAGERAGSVVLTFQGGDHLGDRTLTLTAPADALLTPAFREGRKQLRAWGEADFLLPWWIVRPLPGEQPQEPVFGQAGVTVWRDRPGSLPLTVTHLARLRDLRCFGQTVHAVWQPEPAEGVTVTLTV